MPFRYLAPYLKKVETKAIYLKNYNDIKIENDYNHNFYSSYLISKIKDSKNKDYIEKQIKIEYFLFKLLNKGKLEFAFNEFGKPYLIEGPFFNISHSENYFAIIIGEKEVAIDIEEINNKKHNFKNLISRNELHKFNFDPLMLFTIKECYIKYVGTTILDIKNIKIEDIKKENDYYVSLIKGIKIVTRFINNNLWISYIF